MEIRRLQPLVSIRMPGAPEPQRRVPARVERRRVDFLPPTPQATPCVLWQGIVDRDGYGRLKVPGEDGRLVPTGPHRWVMDELRFAETGRHLRPDEFVLHLCDNPPCFRVSHLVVGTVQDNNADMLAKGRASPPPRNVFYGENHPGSKLTEAQVAEIRLLWRGGMGQTDLALRFGVGRSAIRKVVTGKTWRFGSAPSEPKRSGRVKQQPFQGG